MLRHHRLSTHVHGHLHLRDLGTMSTIEQIVGPHENTARLLYQHYGILLLWVFTAHKPSLARTSDEVITDLRVATSGVNIITDFWIIALPIKTLNSQTRPLKEKIALACIFGAGSFATVMSIVRLQSIYTYTLATDPFRDGIAVSFHFDFLIHSRVPGKTGTD